MDRADDRLPYDLPEFEAALSAYYALRDWNADGTVPDEKVRDHVPDAADGAPAAD
jgi:aldehyde:ferredoxin oxidoreductase